MVSSERPDIGDVGSVWWPLAASWLLMAAEIPMVSAVVARLANPEVHLAAFGGILFPVLLLIESPVIMLLAASTALSRDRGTYLSLRRYTHVGGAVLTGLHLLIVFTPLYDVLAFEIIGAPGEIVDPARIGLMVGVPWTWAIAYRRFNQGILIRHGHSRAVSVGTVIRLIASATVLAAGYLHGGVPGATVAGGALSAGVLTEAAFIGSRTRPVVRQQVWNAPSVDEELTLGDFASFYVPLALTSLLSLLVQPLGSAAISRMPRPLECLAAWPVVFGLIFILRSGGIAYKEVVVAVLDRPDPGPALRRFTALLAGGIAAVTLLVGTTPLSSFWFYRVSGLTEALGGLAVAGFWYGVLIPVLGVGQNWYVGHLVHCRETRAVTESVAIFLAVCAGMLWLGVEWQVAPGLFVAMIAVTVGNMAQMAWVWWRSRAARRAVA